MSQYLYLIVFIVYVTLYFIEVKGQGHSRLWNYFVGIETESVL